ncbi:hypothetical protein IL306_002651 [Fusarium sp. DS 682]|nr:hypothetical protein IL306_002651 [Fusarium sp. DS 682]
MWSELADTAGDTSLSTAPNTHGLNPSQGSVPRTIEVYGYENRYPDEDAKLGDREEIESLISVDDDIQSTQSTESDSTSLRAYRVASKLLIERFLDDDSLLALYQEAVKRLDKKRFIRNHTTLMKTYFLDLRAAIKSRAEELSVDFLRSRAERTRISSVIYDLILEQREQVREIVKMEIKENKESISLVDRFLAHQEQYDRDGRNSPESDSSDSADDILLPQERTSLGESSKLHAVATFMTVGPAFDSYKNSLEQFLHPQKEVSNDSEGSVQTKKSFTDQGAVQSDLQEISKLDTLNLSDHVPETGSPVISTSHEYLGKLTGFLSWLMKMARPRVKKGYRRLEWTCDCGSQLYADFLVLDEERFQRFARSLQEAPLIKSEKGVRNLQSSEGSSSNGQEGPTSSTSNPNHDLDHPSLSPTKLQDSDKSNKATPQTDPSQGQRDMSHDSGGLDSKYLAICIQTGPIHTILEEFDTSDFKSDATLLEAMKSVYIKIRGVRSKQNSLFTPVGMEFVKFTLWNQRHGYVSICERPDSMPPKSQHQYDYDPKPPAFLPPMPAEVFLHYLEHGEEGWNTMRYLWLPRLPVRRENRIIEGGEASYGWGIHIIEGPNRWVICALFLLALIGSALAAILWSAIYSDIQGGTGLGQLIIALSSAMLTALLFRLGYL